MPCRIEIDREFYGNGISVYQAFCDCGWGGHSYNSQEDDGDENAYQLAEDEGVAHLERVGRVYVSKKHNNSARS